METAEEILGRIHALALLGDEPRSQSDQEDEDHYSQLISRGYPHRCVEFLRKKKIDGMVGPAKDLAFSLWERYISTGDFIIVLCGKPGTGKTLMCTVWAYMLLTKQNYCGYYRKVVDLLREFTDNFDNNGSESRIMDRYKNARYLALDEYNVIGNYWKNETLNNLIDHRYDNMVGTVIVTNMTSTDFQQNVSSGLLDRIYHNGTIVSCDWRSYRRG